MSDKSDLYSLIQEANTPNIFVRSVKLADKEYRFQHDIDLVQRGQDMLRKIDEHLGTHLRRKLYGISLCETEEQWNRIDLAEAMLPIEEMCS